MDVIRIHQTTDTVAEVFGKTEWLNGVHYLVLSVFVDREALGDAG